MLKGEILVVDDTPANLEMVCQILEDAAYEVATAIDGARALKMANNYPPDLILLDVQMPRMDGFETCYKLKVNPKTAAIPVIFMTALTDSDSKVKGFDLGAVDYITKPFQEKELLARVRTHLQLRQWSQTLETHVAERTQELQAALKRLDRSQLQLVQSEKMSVLGNLVAGVAHEINNPVGFLQGNIQPAREYVGDLLGLIDLLLAKLPSLDEEVAEELQAIDLDFVRQDLPKLLNSMMMGVERLRHISISLRTFSRTDKEYKVPFNLHDGLDSTLLILKHRLKANEKRPGIEVVKEYGELPEIDSFPGQLNQVFMNLIANAIDALDEFSQEQNFEEMGSNPNRIIVQTQVNGDRAMISIRDNGKGMPVSVRNRIFEQGFTTKEVGKGTGLGLAIAHQIITEQHGGTISCLSELGKGTTFVLELPLSS